MKPLTSSVSLANTPRADVYTDLSSLEAIKHSKDKDASLKQVAQQFESIFVNQMLKGMRQANAVFEQDSPFQSEESKFYRDMHDQQLALTLSTGRGLGIADAMYRQLSAQFKLTRPEENKALIDPAQNVPIRQAEKLTGARGFIAQTTESENPAPLLSARKNAVETKVAVAQSPEEFIDKYLPYFKSASQELGVDPLVLVSQSALETGWGKKVIANERGDSSNNLFNIKAHSDWGGEKVDVTSLEFENGQFSPQKSSFRQYESISESVKDYVDFIKGNPRYEQALNHAGTAKKYVEEIAKAGYATDPQYTDKVISVLKRVIAHVEKSSPIASANKKW